MSKTVSNNIDDKLQGFLAMSETMYFGVVHIMPDYLSEHMQEVKDVMTIANMAIKNGLINVSTEIYEDESYSREFKINTSNPTNIEEES